MAFGSNCRLIQQDLIINLAQDYVSIYNDRVLTWVNKISFRHQFPANQLKQISELRSSQNQKPLHCQDDPRVRRLEAAIRFIEFYSRVSGARQSLAEYLRVQQSCQDEDSRFYASMFQAMGRP